jgi:hypothetical protein
MPEGARSVEATRENASERVDAPARRPARIARNDLDPAPRKEQGWSASVRP